MRESGVLTELGAHLRVLQVLRDDGATQLLRVVGPDGSVRGWLVKRRSGSPSLATAVALHTDQEMVTRHSLACGLPLECLEGSGPDATLFFADPGGDTLEQMDTLSLSEAVDAAIGMARALNEIHAAGILHRDLRPSSFLIADGGVHITDFSRAVRLQREHKDLQIVQGDLAPLRYIAPELTGRFNRPVDFRADYYGLGAVLYAVFTGAPPFAAEDPHELIYQHLAVSPESPGERNPALPSALARIILHLLEKDPDRRYQSGDELVRHLELVREIVAGRRPDTAELAPVRVAQRPLDVLHRLYGRETERARLLERLERAVASHPQLLLIGGASGIGKTTLIRETYLPVTRHCAFFVTGKFDQLQRGRPYSAWIDALEGLVAFVLAEPAERLEAWRSRLGEALGPQAGVLCELLPSLRALLGDVPAPQELPPAEAKERFRALFLRLFEVFSQSERPLVVFLDDLQWIDSASLELLETLVRRLDSSPLLLIGAYRANEVDGAHPLMMSLDALPQRGRFELDRLTLRPLALADVVRLLAEGAQRPPAEVADLSAELMRRTGGNPFFLWQFLRTMREKGWLAVDAGCRQWTWDLSAIQEVGFADQVVDLMLHRFQSLPQACRELLAWAACLGTSFDLEILAWLADGDVGRVHRDLQPALEEEFVLPLGEPELVDDRVVTRGFRFFHDRMQEAAYRASPQAEVVELHYRIARLLRQRLPEDEREARVSEIAGHLNLARSLIVTAGEGLDLARLNLRASRKARAAAAFGAAVEHLRLGMSRLPPDPWAADADLAYWLYRERGELEYLDGDFEAAEWFVGEAIRQEADVHRRADLYYMQIVQNTLRARYAEAVATARQGLALFGETLPETDFEQERDSELAAVRDRLGGRPLDVLGELPWMEDTDQRAVMKLLTSLGPPCYRAHPRLWSVIVAREIRLCLDFGTLPGASYSYPAFGGLLTHVGAGTGEDGATLYRATERLMSRFPDTADTSVGYLMMGSSLRHWFAPMHTASEDYLAAYRNGQATGNLQYAVYGFGHDTYCRYFRGEPLDELIPRALGYLNYSLRRGNLWGIDLITGALRVFELLHGDWGRDEWPHKEETEAAYVARCEAHGNLQVLCVYNIMRASALLQRGELQAAADSLREAERRLESVSVQGLLPATQFPILKALVLARAPELLAEAGEDTDAYLVAALDRYAQWREHAPENFEYWYQLLVAERARRSGATDAVIAAYEAGLQAAQEQHCWPAAALVAQRAADYWNERGQRAFGDVYARQARQALALGCASAAAEAAAGAGNAIGGEDPGVAGGGPAAPQMDAVIQIAQALSLHTTLDELVPEVIRNVAHQTGAQRVVLMLAEDEELRVAMDSGLTQSRYYDVPPILESVTALPHSIIRYVARTQRTLRFGEGDVDDTPLLREERYLSGADTGRGFDGTIWCVPLTYLGQLIGVLYLEHNLAANAFDERQAPLIEFLAAQAAISVRNIELIRQLGAEARARQEAELRMRSADAQIVSHRQKEQQLEKLANTDALTELANRRLFIDSLGEAWSRHHEHGAPPDAVLMVDIDHFKAINDRYGHDVGDRVLRHLAALFEQTFRPDDLAARIGGEEFAVLLHEADCAEARRVARRLCELVEQNPVSWEGRSIMFTVSVGVACLGAGDSAPEAVFRRADQALYRAKAEGRNRVHG